MTKKRKSWFYFYAQKMSVLRVLVYQKKGREIEVRIQNDDFWRKKIFVLLFIFVLFALSRQPSILSETLQVGCMTSLALSWICPSVVWTPALKWVTRCTAQLCVGSRAALLFFVKHFLHIPPPSKTPSIAKFAQDGPYRML